MSNKSDVCDIFLQFQRNVERLFSSKIKIIQSDWGGEYRSLSKLLQNIGISHRLSCPHTHQQNGAVKCKHSHIVETGLALLSHAYVPLTHWDDAFQTACYLINRLPTHLLKNKSPYELLFKSSPDYSNLRIFGCACWPNLRPYNSHKLQPRSTQCVFLGYSLRHKGYKCLNLNTGRLYISRDVLFKEFIFPFQSTNTLQSGSTSSEPVLTQPIVSFPTPPPAHPHPNILHSTPSPILSSPPESSISPIPLSPSSKHSVPPSPLLSHPNPPPNSHPMLTRAKNNIFKPKVFNDGTSHHPIAHALTATSDLSITEPTCFSQASTDSNWRQAMNSEFDALLKNHTWRLVPASKAKNLVGCKWVFRIKRKADGSIDRYKARLVAKGFHQQAGVDFSETYSPVIKPTTVRLVLSINLSSGWSIKQIDIQNAFLHGLLYEEVYMPQPPGFTHPQFPDHVCRLQKALYGLKQAPGAWFSRLSSKLIEFGFVPSQSDSSLFIYKSATFITYILIYVDDIIITSSKPEAITELLNQMESEFAVKQLGDLNFFLGIEMSQQPNGIILSQRRYILDILKCTNMSDAKPVSTPMATSVHLTAHDEEIFDDPTLYRSTIGAFQYLHFTRPDIAFTVNRLSQFLQKPLLPHWQAAKHLLRYIKQMVNFGLHIQQSSSTSLQAFSDADWAGSRDDRRSTGGYCVYLGKKSYFLELQETGYRCTIKH
jgi:hypothetical protein